MTILIIGASGLIGGELLRTWAANGVNVIATVRESYRVSATNIANVTYRELELIEGNDLCWKATIKDLLSVYRPDAVIYCAAFSWVDGCERDRPKARFLNTSAPLAINEMSEDYGSKFVYFSSAYVFDGRRGDYGEDDAVNPLNFYGVTKAEAEAELLRPRSGKVIILRTMMVYGFEMARKNYLYQVLAALKEGRKIESPIDQFGNPSWSRDIADHLLDLLRRKAHGVVHAVGNDPLSKCEMALGIANSLKLDPANIVPIKTVAKDGVAVRPSKATLVKTQDVSLCHHYRSLKESIPILEGLLA